jgi:hypothetical protein
VTLLLHQHPSQHHQLLVADLLLLLLLMRDPLTLLVDL